MQVFGLPGHVIRNDAVARWRRAIDKGLSAAPLGFGVLRKQP